MLDVYRGEGQGPPPMELWNAPHTLITPHTSYATEPELLDEHMRGIEVFLENLSALAEGRPLTNVVDWERGY